MAGESLRSGVNAFSVAMRRSYQYLGTVMGLSLVWFALAALPAGYLVNFFFHVPHLLSVLILCVEMTFLSGPVTAAVCAVAQDIIREDDVSFGALWHLFRRHYLLSVKVTAAMMAIIFVLVVDVIWFLRSPVRLFNWLSVIWIYFIAFWFLMLGYIYPLITYKPVTWWKALYQGALLALDNVVVSIMVIAEVLLIALLCFFFILPVPVYLGGAIVLIQVATLREVLAKYEGAAPLPSENT